MVQKGDETAPEVVLKAPKDNNSKEDDHAPSLQAATGNNTSDPIEVPADPVIDGDDVVITETTPHTDTNPLLGFIKALEVESEPNGEVRHAQVVVNSAKTSEGDSEEVGDSQELQVQSQPPTPIDPIATPLYAAEHTNIVIQDSVEETPPVVQKDLRILSKFWRDAMEDEDEIEDPQDGSQMGEDPHFEVVLSKSQKKKLQKKKAQGKCDKYYTRARAGPTKYAS